MADKSKLIDINGLKTFKSNYDIEIDAKIAQGGGGVSPEQKAIWDAKYDKPEGGIPKTDLASAVQTSLGKADTALQSFTESDPTVPSHVKSITQANITSWNGKASTAVATTSANGLMSASDKTKLDAVKATYYQSTQPSNVPVGTVWVG